MAKSQPSSPLWSNEDADDFWDDEIGGLDDDFDVPEETQASNGLSQTHETTKPDIDAKHNSEAQPPQSPAQEALKIDKSTLSAADDTLFGSQESLLEDSSVADEAQPQETAELNGHGDKSEPLPHSVPVNAAVVQEQTETPEKTDHEETFESGNGQLALQPAEEVEPLAEPADEIEIEAELTDQGEPEPIAPKPASEEEISIPVENGTNSSSLVDDLKKEIERLTLELNSQTTANASGFDELTKVKLLEEKLAEAELDRDKAQSQLEGFLSKISSMKSVFQNYKTTQMELEEVRLELAQVSEEHENSKRRMETMEKESSVLAGQLDDSKTENARLSETVANLKSEATELNSECDRLSQQLSSLRREFQDKDDSLQDEKYSLENEVSRLTKKLAEQKQNYEELELAKEEIAMETKNLMLVIEELKDRANDKDVEVAKVQSVFESVKNELEERVEKLERDLAHKESDYQAEAQKSKALAKEIEDLKSHTESQAVKINELTEANSEISELKQDVQSKQLIIGKLRHEAIILNEHLTKSLSMLKQKLGDTEATVDRELVSNLFLNFLQIPRGDTKKFEALLLIGGLLSWDDEKKIQAGLMHTGKNEDGKPGRLSLISLWTEFLDKESSKK